MAEKREKTVLKIDNKIEFPKTSDSSLMTSQTLGKYVNTLFSSMFADYSGCKVYPTHVQDAAYAQAHPVTVDLIFTVGKPIGQNGKILAFKQVSDIIKEKYSTGAKKNISSIVCGYNMAVGTSKSTEITQEAIDLLFPMVWFDVAYHMSNDPTPEQFSKKIVMETSTPSNVGNMNIQPSQRNIHNVVRWIDINSILYTLFGSGKDSPYMYQTVPVKPIGFGATPNMPGTGADIKWLYSITRIDKKNLFDLCNDLGMYDGNEYMNMCTEKF